jgi:ubiquinone/menaquinone biosynthesis C-methylase UbiE
MTLPAYAMNQSNFAEMYERWLVEPLFRPWAEVLLDRVSIASGDRVLDLACGTGIVARLAKERLGNKGRVVGVDLSPQMLDVGRTIAPSIEWREGNAMALPFDETEKFDVVVCQQGLQFFPDKAAAAREMRRVLAPGGRLAVATWRPLEEVPIFTALHRVAERHLGPVVDHRHGFGDAMAIERLLADAGFHDVRVEKMSRTVRFADAAPFVRLNTMALVGMSTASATTSDEQRAQLVAAIVKESADVLPPYADGEGIAFAISTNVATARG